MAFFNFFHPALMLSPALLHVLVVADLLFSRRADFRILGRALLRGLIMAHLALDILALLRGLRGALVSGRLEALVLHLCRALLGILCSAFLRHLVMTNFTLHITALFRVLHRTFEAGHIVAFFAFLCAADFVELERAFLKRFLMADLPWTALAFFMEFSGTFLGEFFITLFLLLCATYFPLRGVALFFMFSLAVGHLLHRARGAVLRLALILKLVSTDLFNRSCALRGHHILPLETTKLFLNWRPVSSPHWSCN